MHKLASLSEWGNQIAEDWKLLNSAFARFARDSWSKQLIHRLPAKLSIGLMERLFIPGMMHHYLFRKRFIEEQLATAVCEGVRQVLVLGAGFDALAIRKAKKNPRVRFFEIDFALTQAVKLSALEKINYPIPANCSFLAADLSATHLESILIFQKGFDRAEATLVILEGVLMYLTETEARSLFLEIGDLFVGRLAVIFGAMATSDEKGSWSVRAVNRMLSKGREETKWSCPSHDMPDFIVGLGYELRSLISYKDLQRPWRSPSELQSIPNEDENYYVVERVHMESRVPRPNGPA